ncbi:O-antigen ligase family protein [Naasia lichenicola]|uniref:O-antigen ligase family protein n=1 Tax=Naasia lichenicola TaxID=2565933 RepID=UPI00130D73C5|nr:O-antigen ligase family protein [Naasia lichenicola]
MPSSGADIDAQNGARSVSDTVDGGAHRRDLPAVAVIVAMFALVFVPNIIQKFLGGASARIVGASVVDSAQASLTRTIISLVAIILCVYLIVRRQRRSASTAPAVAGIVVLLIPWLLLTVFDFFGHRIIPSPQSLLYPLLCVAIWRARLGESGLRVIARCAIAVAAISVILGSMFPNSGLETITTGQFIASEKALLFGSLLSGVYFSGNNLGQFLVLLLPLMLYLKTRFGRVLGVVLVVFAIVWTGSRSSLITMIVIAVLALLLVLIDSDTSRRRLAWVVGTIALIVSLLVPFFFSGDARAFTGRGHIWATTLSYVAESPILGMGSRWFTVITGTDSDFGSTANQYVFHAHNQWLQLLATGGVVLSIAVLAMLFIAMKLAIRSASHRSMPAALYIVAFLLSGILELNLGFVDRAILWPSALLPLAVIVSMPKGIRFASKMKNFARRQGEMHPGKYPA